MRSMIISALLLPLAAAAGDALTEPTAKVVLHRVGQAPVDDATRATLKRLAMELLKSSNFNTVTHAHVLKQTVPAVQARYRRVAASDHLVITYDEPITVNTTGVDVSVYEIIIGLAHAQYADALFTIDADGRVVAHEKYSGNVAVELRKAAAFPAEAR